MNSSHQQRLLSVRSNTLPRFARAILAAALAVSVAFLAGCHSLRGTMGSGGSPTVRFTTVPLAGKDNPDKVSMIRGVVFGAQPGDRIILYAKAETAWWVQPRADKPFTLIEPNSRWQSSTHPGTEYAALLVGPDFHPPATANVLPTDGVIATAITNGEIAIPKRWWFPLACVLVGAAAIFGLHRFRLLQISRKLNLRFEERLAERTRVAQELHDTLLQGLLSASMQLHVAVDQMPENAPTRPALNRVLQMMEQIVEEGRNTLRGLRSPVDSAQDLKTAFSRIPQEFGEYQDVNFRVVMEGTPVPLRAVIRDEVYSIGREALVNAFLHAQAGNIKVELEYDAKQLRLLVLDDGCGIDEQVLQLGRDGHWGLSGMRERAERIGASLKVRSRTGNGTEVELRVPWNEAFESDGVSRPSKLFSAFYRQRTESTDAFSRKRTG